MLRLLRGTCHGTARLMCQDAWSDACMAEAPSGSSDSSQQSLTTWLTRGAHGGCALRHSRGGEDARMRVW